MREINAAYLRLAEMLAPDQVQPESSVASNVPERRRLSREEIEAMIRAVGSEGPVDSLLTAMGWIGGTIKGILALLFVVACTIRLVMLLFSGNFSAILEDPALLLFLLLLVLMLAHEYQERRNLQRGQ